MSKISPFDFVKSINEKTPIDRELISDYNAFIVNRSLSYSYDTVMAANEMNRYHFLDKDIQFDFLNDIIKKKKRWSKWIKADSIDDIEVIRTWYQVNRQRAMEILSLLNSSEIADIKIKLNHGGKK